MKKWMYFLLCAVLLCTAACANDKKQTEKDTTEEITENMTEESTEETVALEDSETDAEAAYKEEDYYDGVLWKAVIGENWILDEENSAEDGSETLFTNPEGEEIIKISIMEGADANAVRGAVEKAGYSLMDFQEKKIEGGHYVGSHYGVKYTEYMDQRIDFRSEKQQTNVSIVLKGDQRTEDDERFLQSFILLTEETDQTDPPYPHEGEELNPDVSSVSIGDHTIRAEFMKLDPVLPTYEIFDVCAQQSGDYFYVSRQNVLYIYDLANGMKEIKRETLANPITNMTVTPAGEAYITEPMKENYRIEKETVSPLAMDIDKNLHVHPSGEWGVSHFFNMDQIEKIGFQEDGSIAKEPMQFIDENGDGIQTMAAALFVLDDRIAIAGNAADESGYVIGVYHLDGTLDVLLRNEDEKNLGSITGFSAIGDRYLGCDANLRDFYLWDKEGTFLGAAEDKELLGLDYPWKASFFEGQNGNHYLVCTQRRDDQSSNEILIFRIDVD